MCVFSCAGKGQLVSKCPLESPPVEREGPVFAPLPPHVEEKAAFQITQRSWKEQSYGHGFRRDTKTRLTVLARTSSNLPNRLCI
jgi:hypothetical protein